MNKENIARIEPSFFGADEVAQPGVETAVPAAVTGVMGRAEPEFNPQGSPQAETQAGPQDAATAMPASGAGRKFPVKPILLGGAGLLIAGLIGTIAWLSSKAGEQRLRPPEQMALAAPAGMSAKILPMPEAHALDPVRDVPSAMLPPSQPQVPVAPPPLPVSASPAPAQAAPAESAAPLAAAAIAPTRAVGPVAARTVTPIKHVVPKAATSKAKKPAKVAPAKDGRKNAALKPAPARKAAAKTAPRCDAHNRNLARCRALAKAGRT
jgi:hypothetical protein